MTTTSKKASPGPASFLKISRLTREINALGNLEGSNRLSVGAELLGRLLMDLEELTSFCWAIRATLGLIARPDEPGLPERRPLLSAVPQTRAARGRA